jgi:putative flippase GtrA
MRRQAVLRLQQARTPMVFTTVGAVATAGHYTLYILLVEFGIASPVLSATLGYSLGALISYWLNHRITFRSDRPHRSAMPRFALVVGTGIALNTALVALAYEAFRLQYLLAQLFATMVVFLFNYSASRHWAFASREPMSPMTRKR